MKLSIIVPAYNAEGCLRTCLEGLLAQDVEDFEIIIVNDGSTDGTAAIIAEYCTQYPSIFKAIQLSNGGQGRARNFALREAKGEYIGFADADDRTDPSMFSKMLKKAKEEDADIVICDFFRVDESGTHYEKAALQNHPLSAAGAVWNKIFRTSAVKGVRFAEGLWYEDLAFSAKMLLKSKKTVYIDEALYYYICGHTSTMTNQNSEKNLDIIKVCDDIKAFAAKYSLPADMDFLILNHVLLESIKRVNLQKSPKKKEVIKQLRNYTKQNVPHLQESKAYLAESRNRRLIMKLIYDGHENMAERILKLK